MTTPSRSDQAAIGLGREQGLRGAEHGQRVADAREDGEEKEHDKGGSEFGNHGFAHTMPAALTTMSIALMPMKGTISPPSP